MPDQLGRDSSGTEIEHPCPVRHTRLMTHQLGVLLIKYQYFISSDKSFVSFVANTNIAFSSFSR